MRNKRLWRVLALPLAVLLLGNTLTGYAAVLTDLDERKTALLTEPTATVEHLSGLYNNNSVTAAQMNWVDGGVHGKALALSGLGDCLEYQNEAACAGDVTLTAWVNWQGSATADVAGEYNQQLFTLYRDEKHYLTASVRGYRDNVKATDDGAVYRLDGVHLEYNLEGSIGKKVECYTPVTGDVHYALPQNKWTHIAMTLSDNAIKLYVNGKRWFEQKLPDAATELDAKGLRIGGSLNGSPTLNAQLDEVAIYRGVLNTDTIAHIVGQDAAAAKQADAATRPSAPAAPAEPEEDAMQDVDNTGTLSIPPFVWYVEGSLVVLLAVLTVLLNRHEQKREGGNAK